VHFLNPIALFGLAAAAIPLVIHLLHRGRTTPLPFSNLAFLQVVHQQRMRRLQLRQWLALLIRTLAILFAVAAFARPAFRGAGGGGSFFGSPAPTRALVLIDRSYSTAYRTPSGRLFDRIRENAASLLNLFTTDDEVSFVSFAGGPLELGERDHRQPDDEPDSEMLVSMLNRLTVSEEATRIDLALQYAERHFSAERMAGRSSWNKEVFLFTDRSQHNWDELEPSGAEGNRLPGVHVYLNDVDDLDQRSNTFIETVEVDRWMAAPGHMVELRVLVVNASSRPLQAVPVDLYLDGERLQRRLVELPEQGRIEVVFSVAPRRAGLTSGYVEVGDDGLALDNRHYFSFHVADRVRVLLVGTPRDVYYPRRALEAAAASDPALQLLPAASADRVDAAVREADVVILCNVERLSMVDNRAVHRFVAAGGGLIIFPAPGVDLSSYNRHLLPELLPASLVGLSGRGGGAPVTSAQARDSARALDADRPHHRHLLADLWPVNAEDDPTFTSTFELTAGDHLEPVASFADGGLALAMGHRGRGTTVLSSFPLDLSWSDLPVKGMFAPLIHRLCRYLAYPGHELTSYTVGEAVRRRLIESVVDGTVQVEGPSGRRQFIEVEHGGGQLSWSVPAIDEAGIWRVFGNGELVDRFAVNLDTRESRLAPLRATVVRRLFDGEFLHLLPAPGEGTLADFVLAQRYGHELWRPFLIIAALFLLAELWIARAPHTLERSQNDAT